METLDLVTPKHRENVERASILKGRLERVLNNVTGQVSGRDLRFLEGQISDYDYFVKNAEMGSPLPSLNKKAVRKIIRHKRLYDQEGKEVYDVNGVVCENDDLKEIAKNIFSEFGDYLSRGSMRFLRNGIIGAPNSESFSAKQILYLEGLQGQLEKNRGHLDGEEFNPYIYRSRNEEISPRLLTFAVSGKMGKGVPQGDYLGEIESKWYDSQTGLQSLREALSEYIGKKRLKVGANAYEPVIRDLEKHFRVKNRSE